MLAGDSTQADVAASAHRLADRVIEWRRHLHEHPELSFDEHQTAAYVRAQLESLPEIEFLETAPETSVVAILRRGAGPVVALRADLDALPIQEDNGNQPVRSLVDGVMHACGHDGHAAMLIGAAHLLAEDSKPWSGEIRFIFQHAEELPPGGARDIIAAGALDGAACVVGCHLWAYHEAGLVAFAPGPRLAGNDSFSVEFEGSGGHAAAPHQTSDALTAAAAFVSAVDHLAAREIDPFLPVVVAVTVLAGGTATNVVPKDARVGGTIRYFDPEVRARVARRISELADGVARGFDVECRVVIDPGYEPVINDEDVTALARSVAQGMLGESAVIEMEATMGSEDFGALSQVVPGTYFLLGARNEAIGAAYPHHHPQFSIDESVLEIGVGLLAGIALRVLDDAPPC